jgi:hypothetical protein
MSRQQLDRKSKFFFERGEEKRKRNRARARALIETEREREPPSLTLQWPETEGIVDTIEFM